MLIWVWLKFRFWVSWRLFLGFWLVLLMKLMMLFGVLVVSIEVELLCMIFRCLKFVLVCI